MKISLKLTAFVAALSLLAWTASLSASTKKVPNTKPGLNMVEIVNSALACLTVKPVEVDHDDQLILLETQLTASQGSESCGCQDGFVRWSSSRGQNGATAATGIIRDPFLTHGSGAARKYTFVLESDSAVTKPEKYFLKIDCKTP